MTSGGPFRPKPFYDSVILCGGGGDYKLQSEKVGKRPTVSLDLTHISKVSRPILTTRRET